MRSASPAPQREACRITSWLEKAQQDQPSLAALPNVFEHGTHLGGADLFGRQEVEGVAHLHAVSAGGVGGNDLQPALRIADFADRGGGRIFVEQGAEALEEGEVFRPALVVEVVLVVVGVDGRRGLVVALVRRQRRIVLQPLAEWK